MRGPSCFFGRSVLLPQTKGGVQILDPFQVLGVALITSAGPKNEPPCFTTSTDNANFEAVAAYQWCNFLHTRVARGTVALNINLDETAVRLFQMSGPGHVAIDTKRRRRQKERPVQNVGKQQARAAFTHVVMVADDTLLQPLLPQVLIFNKHMLSARDHDRLKNQVPRNVYLLRQTTGWVTEQTMLVIVRLLHACLRDMLAARQVVLSCDAYRAHMTPAVARLCYNLGIYLFYIPAKLTWVLQPCDTHVLAQYKRHLRMRFQSSQLECATGRVDLDAVIDAVCHAIRHVLQGKAWRRAFQDTGLTGHQREVSESLLRKLQWEAPPVVGAGLPSLAQLASIYPRGALIPVEQLFGKFREGQGAGEAQAQPTASASLLETRPENPWQGRTRSSSSLGASPAPPPDAPCRPPLPPPSARPFLAPGPVLQLRARLPPRPPAAQQPAPPRLLPTVPQQAARPSH